MGCIQNVWIIQVFISVCLDAFSFSCLGRDIQPSFSPDIRGGGPFCCYGVGYSICQVCPYGFIYSCRCVFYQAAPIFPVQASSLWSGAFLAGRFFLIGCRLAVRRPFFGCRLCRCLGGLRFVFPFRGG